MMGVEVEKEVRLYQQRHHHLTEVFQREEKPVYIHRKDQARRWACHACLWKAKCEDLREKCLLVLKIYLG